MQYKRNLKYGMRGTDVRYIKELLFLEGYYAPSVAKITNDRFGSGTLAAVLLFQRRNRDEDGKQLSMDGALGEKTWNAIERARPPSAETMLPLMPEQLSEAAKRFVGGALEQTDETRRELVLAALPFAFDPAKPRTYPLSLYIRGGNLYNVDLTINVITAARIEAGAKRQPQYYDGGRKEMMLAVVRADPLLTGADCSGGVIGLLRKFQLVKRTFDATADLLLSSRYARVIPKEELIAGDWVGKSGHIGMYAGGGYVVEWMGGAYGCQLSKLDDRRGYNFVRQRLVSQSAWTRFRRPSLY